MVSAEDLKKDEMWFEAVDRLEMMGAKSTDCWMVLMNRGLDLKIVVDHKARTISRQEITDEELKMVKEVEQKFPIICYYLIEDEMDWPDGSSFKRYTLFYVDEHSEEYEMVHKECIECCGTIPAYVINVDVPECSEITEVAFRNVEGNLINAS